MSKELSATNRKTHRMIAKNLIILLVVAIIAALAIWAWFTTGSTATADGISVEARSTGVEVSWSGATDTYYRDLTATKEEELDGVTGYAHLNSETDFNGDDATFKLVTGNGLNFFAPLVNRRTGDIIKESETSDAWMGTVISAANNNTQGRFLDVDLYFRSDKAATIYLAKDSRVLPKLPNGNMSEFGDFSKDYICAAARVAFLNADKDKCSFIWAPNKNYELQAGSDGYTRYSTVSQTTETTTVGGGIDGGAVDDGNTYYFWTIAESANYNGGDTREVDRAIQFNYDASIKYFVAEITYTVPTYTNNSPSIPFLISQSSSSPLTSTFTIDAQQSWQMMYGDDTNPNASPSLIYISNQSYNAASFNGTKIENGNQFYFRDQPAFTSQSKVTIKFGFNPQSKIIQVIGYSGGASWDQGTGSEVETTVNYYEINNCTAALANYDSKVTASTKSDASGKAVSASFASSNLINLSSVMATEQFKVTKTGEGTSATYKLKNVSTGQYLNLSSANGAVSFSTTATEFSLGYDENVTGPLLVSGDYYLAYINGALNGVALTSLNPANVVTIYIGTSYAMEYSSISPETYQYYDSTSKSLVTLNESSSPPLYDSAAVAEGTSYYDHVCETAVTTLTKDANSEYYTSHIVIRIWVEGTDREAKTPLANGIFTTSLHFVSEVEKTT